MTSHYLAIQHESYDSSTVYGVFDTFEIARDHLEAEASKPDSYSSAKTAEIEEWDGDTQTANFERDWSNCLLWKERRYAIPAEQETGR